MLKWKRHLLFVLAQLVLDADVLDSSVEISSGSCSGSSDGSDSNSGSSEGQTKANKGAGGGEGGGGANLNSLTNTHLKNIPPRRSGNSL